MPAVLMYVQHLLGIGHLMRSRAIAQALAEDGHEVHLVSGGRPVAGREPAGVHELQLPPIHAADARLAPLLGEDGKPIDDAYRQRRTATLLGAYKELRPDAVIVETFPFGRGALRFELVPLLERIHASHPRPVVVSSVRDILQRRSNLSRLRDMRDAANHWFDAILVHGDERFARLEETFPVAAELEIPVHYTGFVLAHQGTDARQGHDGRDEVLVSAGGGAVGEKLLDAALRARVRSRLGALRWRMLVGNNVSADAYARLRAMASDGVVVERARPDFPALLRRARVSVSQAGYNTVLDVARSGVRAVLVPFAGEGETEQADRAARLAALGLAVVADEHTVGADTLAAAIDAAAQRPSWGRWDFSLDGATASAALVGRMIGTVRSVGRHPSAAGPRHGTRLGAHAPGWDRLDAELDAWRAQGRTPALWWRDDDAIADTAALRPLLALAAEARMPVAIAAIPALLEPSLAEAILGVRDAAIVQHGYAHRNHAPPAERKCELGMHRTLRAVMAELGRGFDALARAFGPRFVPVLVPPWNRIDRTLVPHLPALGLRGLSTWGPRAAAQASPGVVEVNTHVDLIDWARARSFVGEDAALDKLVRELEARRTGRVDALEPCGVLTHHLDMKADAWRFMTELVARTRDADRVQWLDVQTAFDVGAPVTSSRSA